MRRRVGIVAAIACLAGAGAGPASAAVTFGADLSTGDAGQGTACDSYTYAPSGTHIAACVATLVGGDAPAPVKGVITSFSIRMATPVTGRLRLAQIADNSQPFVTQLTWKSTAADAVSVPGDSATHTYNVRLPVAKGDVIGFASSVAIYRTKQGNFYRRVDADSADGTTPEQATLGPGEVSGDEVPINATIEGDADGDGYGDETQDLCPTLASTHDACPGTVPPPSSGPPAGDGGGTPPPSSGPAPVQPDTFAPVLSPVTINHRVFRVNTTAAPARAPKGATLRFSVSEAGTARLSVYLLGRRKRVRIGSVNKPVVAGKNSLAFPGRLRVGTRVRSLSPGRYRVDVQTTDLAGNHSNTASAAFRVVLR